MQEDSVTSLRRVVGEGLSRLGPRGGRRRRAGNSSTGRIVAFYPRKGGSLKEEIGPRRKSTGGKKISLM